MTRSRRVVSAQEFEAFLPPSGLLPFSFSHPGPTLLFSDRLVLMARKTSGAGEILTAETEDGVVFLPFPPFPWFDPGLSAIERGLLLERIFREISDTENHSPPPFLENCPLGLLPCGPFRTEESDLEYVSFASSLRDLRGSGGRALRWESNRFDREHPRARLRPFAGSDREAILSFSARFSEMRGRRGRNPLESLMAQDMGRAFERAVTLWDSGLLEGWILEEEGQILGVEWTGRSLGGTTLHCLLEAREEEISNIGSVLVRKILEEAGGGVLWVNTQGGSGIRGVSRAKRMRPHDLVLPLYRIIPQ